MKSRIIRIIGAAILIIACLWIAFDQLQMGAIPIAMASEAPDRHFPKQETFTKSEAYKLSFSLAKDIHEENPNILFPSALLLIGAWLFFGSCQQPGRKP